VAETPPSAVPLTARSRLREIASKAWQRPWRVSSSINCGDVYVMAEGQSRSIALCDTEENTAFIAAFDPRTVLRLLSALAELGRIADERLRISNALGEQIAALRNDVAELERALLEMTVERDLGCEYIKTLGDERAAEKARADAAEKERDEARELAKERFDKLVDRVLAERNAIARAAAAVERERVLREALSEADETLTEMGWHTERGLLGRIKAALSSPAQGSVAGKLVRDGYRGRIPDEQLRVASGYDERFALLRRKIDEELDECDAADWLDPAEIGDLIQVLLEMGWLHSIDEDAITKARLDKASRLGLFDSWLVYTPPSTPSSPAAGSEEKEHG
jgi:predicted house-cleaning noncanonical NTP pyrophosphatase (MazG superfamily)